MYSNSLFLKQDISLMVTLLIFLPLVSVTFLYSPAAEKIMKEYPLRLSDHEQGKNELRRTCFSYALRFCPSSLVCIWLTCYYFCHCLQIHSQILSAKTTDAATFQMLDGACSSGNKYLVVIGGRTHSFITRPTDSSQVNGSNV